METTQLDPLVDELLEATKALVAEYNLALKDLTTPEKGWRWGELPMDRVLEAIQAAKPALAPADVRGHVRRVGETIFLPLPRPLWRLCGGCRCEYCSADGTPNPAAAWDTLAISATPRDPDLAWTVHAPELHGVARKR